MADPYSVDAPYFDPLVIPFVDDVHGPVTDDDRARAKAWYTDTLKSRDGSRLTVIPTRIHVDDLTG